MESHDRSHQDAASSSAPAVSGESVAANGRMANGELASGRPDLLGDVTLLALGLLLEGASLATRDVRQTQLHETESSPTRASSSGGGITGRMLIGLIAEGRVRARARRAAMRQARRQFARRISSMAEPFTRWLPVDAALAVADILAGYSQESVERIINQLAEHGRIEEERARALARQAFDGWVDEALAYFAQNPAVRDLVTQQGEEMATGALDDLRSRTQSADSWVAQFARRVLQRSAANQAADQDASVATTPAPVPALTVTPSGSGA